MIHMYKQILDVIYKFIDQFVIANHNMAIECYCSLASRSVITGSAI